MNAQELTKTIHDSGIRIMELSKILKVAASTLYRWMKGDVEPKSELHYNAAMGYMKWVQQATNTGLLPVGSDVKGKARLPVIKAAIRAMATKGIEH